MATWPADGGRQVSLWGSVSMILGLRRSAWLWVLRGARRHSLRARVTAAGLLVGEFRFTNRSSRQDRTLILRLRRVRVYCRSATFLVRNGMEALTLRPDGQRVDSGRNG